MDQADLADLLIVSQVEVTVGQAIQATVENAAGDKCQRCWKVLPTVNGEGLCPRCAKVLTPWCEPPGRMARQRSFSVKKCIVLVAGLGPATGSSDQERRALACPFISCWPPPWWP